MQAIREAALRSGKRKGRRTTAKSCYRVSELCRLTELSERTVKRELRAAERASLLNFSENGINIKTAQLPGSEDLCESLSGKRSSRRPIPVPRSVLRFFAHSSQAALGLTMLAYVVRGLSIERKGGEIRSAGTTKASWVAETFGLSLRSVRSSRKKLIEMGFIGKDTGSTQRKLNRDGSYFRINLDWKEKDFAKKEGTPSTLPPEPKIAPPQANSCAPFAPPYKDKKTSNESKNQETQSDALKLSGVFKTNSGKGTGPKLSDVKLDDLKSFLHLEILFQQAVKARWLAGTEANFLNWIAAAVRARTVSARDPVRVFVSIVKKARWDFITQEQEDRARAAIKRFRETPVSDGWQIQTPLKPVENKQTPIGSPTQSITTIPDARQNSKIALPLQEILERLQARQIIEKSFPGNQTAVLIVNCTA